MFKFWWKIKAHILHIGKKTYVKRVLYSVFCLFLALFVLASISFLYCDHLSLPRLKFIWTLKWSFKVWASLIPSWIRRKTNGTCLCSFFGRRFFARELLLAPPWLTITHITTWHQSLFVSRPQDSTSLLLILGNSMPYKSFLEGIFTFHMKKLKSKTRRLKIV